MKGRITAAALILLSGAAVADTIAVFDEAGAPLVIETTTLTTCQVFYDSTKAAFRICPLIKTQSARPPSARIRPGEALAPATTGGAKTE